MRIENENIFRVAFSRANANLFVGAGFFVLANDTSGRPLALGTTLKEELVSEFTIRDGDELSLSQVCAHNRIFTQERTSSYLEGRFSVGKFDERYKSIEHLPCRQFLQPISTTL
jgi:hypothetical protein